MNRVKTITYIPGWAQDDYESNSDKVNTTAQAYTYVPLIYRAVKLRADTLASVPIVVYDGENEIPWPLAIKPGRFLRKSEAARLWAGAAYWLKQPNPIRPKTLDWLNPFTMKPPKVMQDGRLLFKQEIEGKVFGPWEEEYIVYLKDFIAPMDDIGPGISATAAALTDAGLLRYMSRFASRFFEGGGMPVTVIGIDGSIDNLERERVENFFKKNVSGIRNAWRVLAMRIRGTMKPEVISPKISDMAMPALYNQAVKNIAYAYGIPESMLRNDANRASAEENRLSFWQDTVRPAGEAMEDDLNEQLFAPMGLRLELAFDNLDIFQTDESYRADSLLKLTQANMPLDVALEVLGYDLTDEQMLAVIEHMTIPPIPEVKPNEQKSDATPVRDELERWERMVLKRLKQGKPLRHFESDIIPAALSGAIAGNLDAVTTIEGAKSVFHQALAWEGYP